ncbi:MAG TPA: YidB family protein [Burkholderiaceae bacterium]|nr:YidB family protein [Burkholderiaceae bacterium]
MGLLNSVIGALANSNGLAAYNPAFNALVGMLADNSQIGGLDGLLHRMQRGGLGDVANSWISNGQNLPISPEQLQSVLGTEVLNGLAEQFGLGRAHGDVAWQLSQLLPQVVDKLTPDGQAPQEGLGDIATVVGRLVRH